jgi:16S rRNA (cytidine1402-2'-O)-methyltransferase
VFAGWLSPKRENRIKELREFVNEERTVVLLETPYRLEPVLRDISAVLGSERQVAIALNLTMPDEEILRGTAEELHRIAEARKLKGEFVIVIAGKRTSSRK